MMRRVSTAAAAAALMLAAGHASPAKALDTVIGGMASACSKDAKAGNGTIEAINNCTDALVAETMTSRDRAATMVNRGTLYLTRSEWLLAIKDFDNALLLQPHMGEAFVNRGAALIGMQRYAEGEQQIDQGLTLNPELPERAYYNRAIARWRQDDVRGAYFDFQKALELKPGWAEPTQQLAYFTVTRR